MDEAVLKLNLTAAQIDIVLAGLGELPAKHSLETIATIREQAIPQLKEPAVEEE